jgi:hypothetical protein
VTTEPDDHHRCKIKYALDIKLISCICICPAQHESIPASIRKDWKVRGLRKRKGARPSFPVDNPQKPCSSRGRGQQNPTTRNRPGNPPTFKSPPPPLAIIHHTPPFSSPRDYPPPQIPARDSSPFPRNRPPIRPAPNRRRIPRDGGRGRGRCGGGEGARPLPGRPPPGGAGALLRGAGGGEGPRAAHHAA